MSHIFISYSRKDLDFAQKIVDALAANDLDTWIDWKSIPKGEDWEQEIYRGIEEADAFLFPDQPRFGYIGDVQQRDCTRCQKRQTDTSGFYTNVDTRKFTMLRGNSSSKNAKEEINRRNWIFCREGKDDFEKAIDRNSKTIHTDYEWLKYHTQLQNKALAWERNKKIPAGFYGERNYEKQRNSWLKQEAKKIHSQQNYIAVMF